jgi:hypothetical protein
MVQPTATQAENDLAAHGQSVTNKVADGAPVDPYTPPWMQAGAPTNVTLPVISGPSPPVVGSVLMVNNGTWNYRTGVKFTYQWLQGAAAIAGATGNSHTTVTADKTFAIGCTVTATSAKGATNASAAPTVAVP